MGKKFKHLSFADRIKIEVLLNLKRGNLQNTLQTILACIGQQYIEKSKEGFLKP